MSKVAIQGNASGTGTLTIAAPNTNSDRTITLADESGTLLVNGTSNAGFGTTSNLLSGSNRTTVSINNSNSAAVAFGVGGTNEAFIFSDASAMEISSRTNPMRFSTGDAERMRIDSSGNIGIGITSPGATFDVRKNNPPNGRLAVFGSNGTPFTTTASGVPNAVTITRSRIVVASNTTTNLLYGYGGSLALITLTNVSGGADAQYTFLVTHAWSSASVLFTNTYGQNQSTFTFSASTGHLRLNHNHSSSIQANINSLIVPGPGLG